MEAIYKTSNNKGKQFYEGSFYTLWIKKKLRILQRFYFDLKTKKKHDMKISKIIEKLLFNTTSSGLISTYRHDFGVIVVLFRTIVQLCDRQSPGPLIR